MLLFVEAGGVTASLLLAGDINREEARTEGLNLLLDCRPHVKCGHHGPQPAGSRDRLQTRNAGAENEDMARLDRTRCRHQQRE